MNDVKKLLLDCICIVLKCFRMLDFELKLKKFAADTNSSSWMGELLKEIAQAADQLENRVAEHELEKKEIKVWNFFFFFFFNLKKNLKFFRANILSFKGLKLGFTLRFKLGLKVEKN